MSHETLSQQIEKAWQIRVNASPEAALRPLIELKDVLSIPSRIVSRDCIVPLLKRPEAREILDVLVLHVSVTALIGQPDEAMGLMKLLESEALIHGITDSYFLYYERGRIEFRSGDFTRAIESFMRGSMIARTQLQRLWASVNVVFCLENLGLPLEPTLSEVQELINTAGPGDLTQRVLDQLKTVELRQLFRKGQFRNLLKLADKGSVLDQGRYYGMWVKMLPYHKGHALASPEDLRSFSVASSLLLFRSSRMRTLQGLLHPEDFEVTKPSEHVDRFYLWVWRWLQDPEALSAEKITALSQKIDFADLSHRMSVEDGQLLRNAFGWLALFDATSERRLRTLAGLCGQSKGSEDSLFTLEYLVTQYLAAIRDGNRILESDYLTSLKAHCLWDSSDLLFNQLVQGVLGKKSLAPQLAGLVARIRDLVAPKHSLKNRGIMVDEALGQVILAKSGRKVISPSLTRALSLLKGQQTISNDEFVNDCFGIHTYDSTIHNGKIFNLLTRLKALTGADLN
ncbi:MAG: hypothetical protein HYR96_01065, partial [Deltaproteobacteria bacterium]|nr:hypothetical protein [Deltaproteobacteria bacterium]